MKKLIISSSLLLAVLLLAACTDNLDPLYPGSTDGKYASGIKELVPLESGNIWTYNVILYDTAGAVKMRYQYNLTIGDTVTADTNSIPLIPPAKDRKSLSKSLTWYRVVGDMGTVNYWQVDSLDRLCIRKQNDAKFFEQRTFDFRAAVGDVGSYKFISKDTVISAARDTSIFNPDSVRSTLISQGVDTLRTTLGSAVYFCYKQTYFVRQDYSLFYYKPGFGMVLSEEFRRKPNGTMYKYRRDELTTYYIK